MSIASQLHELNEDRQDILDAIEAKGVTVEDWQGFDQMADLIGRISSGGGIERADVVVTMPGGDEGDVVIYYFNAGGELAVEYFTKSQVTLPVAKDSILYYENRAVSSGTGVSNITGDIDTIANGINASTGNVMGVLNITGNGTIAFIGW